MARSRRLSPITRAARLALSFIGLFLPRHVEFCERPLLSRLIRLNMSSDPR